MAPLGALRNPPPGGGTAALHEETDCAFMPLKMLAWKKRTPQCREVKEAPRDAAQDAGSATSATSSDASDGGGGGAAAGGLVRLTDILQAKPGKRNMEAVNMTVDGRVDSRRKPLFREWTLKKSTSTTTADAEGEVLAGALQPGPSQDDLRQLSEIRAVEEQYRRGGDPAQVTQWLAAMAPKQAAPPGPPGPPPQAGDRDSAEADRELARRPLGELAAMERQLQRLEQQSVLQGRPGPGPGPGPRPLLQPGAGTALVRRESERVGRPVAGGGGGGGQAPGPRRPVTLSRTHSDSAPPDGPTPRVQRRWTNRKPTVQRAASSSASPQASPAVVRRAPGHHAFNHHAE
ncbi:DNA-directed RNA polymerase subunit beta', partial [Frankliniella fusca]